MARKRTAKEPDPPPGPPMTDTEREELNARLASMFSKPLKSELIGGRFFLLWVARDAAGTPQTMIWNPETEQELRGANLFYDAAHGLGAFAKPVKKGKPLRRTAEHDALIAGVLANRADDTGYLVYADYLTENGSTQGDYIRLCIELAKLPPGHPDADKLARRSTDLSNAHAEEWFAPLGELGLRPEFHGYFTPYAWLSLERGVIEEVTIDRPSILPKHADRLFAAAPFLRVLKFEQGHLDPTGLAKTKQLSQIEELDLFHTALSPKGLRTILASKHLTGLKALGLGSNAIGDEGARVLAAWPGLAKLETLDVSSCQITPDGVDALATCQNVANLTRLRIGRTTASADSASRLFDSPYLKKLTELELGGTEFFPIVASSFDLASFAKTLTHLDLDCATFQPGAFQAFTQCKLSALQCLKLNSVPLRAPEAANLANATWRGTLTELHLDVCRLGREGMGALVTGKFPRLTKLELSRNELGTRGGIALAGASQSFPALTSLRLWSNKLTPEAVEHLAMSALLANLTELDLNDNKIGPAGAVALAESTFLGKLTSLIVDEKPIGKKGKQALLDRFGESVVSFR
jgi:uncharacterized protein (TIGR02996 family)